MLPEGALGAVPDNIGGGGLSTYKELCSVASELGTLTLHFVSGDNIANRAARFDIQVHEYGLPPFIVRYFSMPIAVIVIFRDHVGGILGKGPPLLQRLSQRKQAWKQSSLSCRCWSLSYM